MNELQPLTPEPADLISIQANLRAPKNLFNSFGKYSYRSCESILQALKPLLEEMGCTLTLSDKMEMVGDRIYVKAIAKFTDSAGNTTKVSAYARESFERKGMDDSMLTGATSSYARKYALSGLFLLDDNKDADSELNLAQAEIDAFKDLVDEGDGPAIFLMNVNDPDKYIALTKAAGPKKGVVKWKEQIADLITNAVDAAQDTAVQLIELCGAGDKMGYMEIAEELTPDEKNLVWRQFKPDQKDLIKELLKE